MPGPNSIGWPGGLTSNCWFSPPLAAALPALGGESVVEQLLLVGNEIAQILHHAAGALLLRTLGEVAGLEPLEHVLELGQHALGQVLRPRLGELLDIFENLVEVLLRHKLVAVLLGLGRHVALVLLLRGKRLQVARQRRAQLVDEALDLLGRGSLLQRLHQRVLGGIQGALGLGQIALLDAERRRPELIDDAGDAFARAVAAQPPIGVAQGEIDDTVVDHLVAPEGERFERIGHAFRSAGIAHQLLALLDHRPGQRLGEGPLG